MHFALLPSTAPLTVTVLLPLQVRGHFPEQVPVNPHKVLEAWDYEGGLSPQVGGMGGGTACPGQRPAPEAALQQGGAPTSLLFVVVAEQPALSP